MENKKNLIIETINEYEWDKVDGVIKSILPNIIFSVDAQKPDQNIVNSRFGGLPVVPDNFIWPIQSLGQKAPLAFFFQLNFEEIKPFDIENVFPNKGILLCFVSVTDDIMWEEDVPDAFKVYYFSDTENLELAKIPSNIPPEQQLSPRTIHFENSFQLPGYPFNFNLLHQNLISEEDADGIDEISSHTIFSHNMLLGVPLSVQHFISEEWAEKHHEDEDMSENYINLISFEMKGHEGYGFSTNGAHLYLCMDKEDLKKADFSKVVTIVQNT